MTTESSPSDEDVPSGFGERAIGLSDELVDVLALLPDELAGLDADEAIRRTTRSHADHLVRWVEVADEAASQPHRHATGGTNGRVDGRPARLAIGDAVVTLRAGEEVVVGRRGEIVVDHLLVSRRHLVVHHGDEGLTCRDLGSANGSWLLRDGMRSIVDQLGCVLTTGDLVVTVDDLPLLAVIEVDP